MEFGSIVRSKAINILVMGLCMCFIVNAQAEDAVLDELNAYWQEVARTVITGDFAAYSRGYHEDAVYVSESKGSSKPIAAVLEEWKQGFTDTQQGKNHPALEFRFSRRLHDKSTAHETGIFRYSSGSDDDQATDVFIHFEALLIKQEQWMTMMEFQKHPATEEEWNAL